MVVRDNVRSRLLFRENLGRTIYYYFDRFGDPQLSAPGTRVVVHELAEASLSCLRVPADPG